MSRTRRQAYGQHFLHHRPTIEKIMGLAESTLGGARVILEVGPGRLALSRDLAALASKQGLPLHLVEKDPRIIEELSRDPIVGSAKLHALDAASLEFAELLRALAHEADGKILIVSNLPYSASSQIIARLAECSEILESAVLMVQRELADRMVAPENTSDRGAFSLLVQASFAPKIRFHVGAGAFSPPPKVESTVLTLLPLSEIGLSAEEKQDFGRYCVQLFTRRRKMIRTAVNPSTLQHFPKLGLSGTERPENLTLETTLALWRLHQSPGPKKGTGR